MFEFLKQWIDTFVEHHTNFCAPQRDTNMASPYTCTKYMYKQGSAGSRWNSLATSLELENYAPPPGLEITVGQRTMSRLIGELTSQLFVLPVMLTGHNRSYWKQLLSVCGKSLGIAKRWSEILGEIQLQPLFTIRALKRTLGFTRFPSQN